MLNPVDRAISFFSPSYALDATRKRLAAKMYASYDASKQSNHYNISTFQTDEDDDIADLDILRATSRSKYNNNGFYAAPIKAAVDHVVGSGLRAKSTIIVRKIPNMTEGRKKEVEQMFDDYFNAWASSPFCDVTAKDNFYEIQRLAYKLYKRDGDCFSLLPLKNIAGKETIQIKLIGAEVVECDVDGFSNGIKTNKDRMPLAYAIAQKDGTVKKVKSFSKGKKNVLHIFERDRASSVRGVPFLTPVMRDIDAIDNYMKYELNAAKLSAIFFGSITTSSDTDIFGNEVDLLSGDQKQTQKNTVKENSITQLGPGEELKIHTQGRDNPNYDKFIMTSMKKVASQTRIPLEIILTQFLSSYSASRAAMLQMQKFVKPERNLFISSFIKPIRDQVITWGVLSGDLDIPDFFENRSAYLQCMWIGDPMGSVDPQKDVKAKATAIDAHLLTREQATVELGYGDFETNVGVLINEKEMIKPLKEEF